MATLTAVPASGMVDIPIVLVGDGFTPGALVTVEIQEEGFSSEIVADGSGGFGTDDIADRAVTTLTVTGQPIAAETVVLGAVTYTFRASVTTVANEVLIGADAAASLANLKAAINLEAGSGTKYGSLTVVHPTVEAFAITATTLKVRAKVGGTAGNALASTETLTNGSFPGATFNSGVPGSAATGTDPLKWLPNKAGTFHAKASDGTNTAFARIPVFIS